MHISISRLIEDALNYIEVRLTQKVNLEEIAQSFHLSKYHLHRLLSHAVGMPVMNYIRARKMSASLPLLLDDRLRIVDIGNHFGFEHEQSYIRAFKKHFGITPALFRKEMPELVLTEKADISRWKEIEEGIIFAPTIVFKPSISLVGVKHTIDHEENVQYFTANQAGNDFFYNHRPLVKQRVQEHIYIGLTRYPSWDERKFTYYTPSAQVSSLEELPPGMEGNLLPPSKYAVFTYVGGFHPKHLTIRHLEEIWSYIDRYVQFNNPGFRQSDLYHFEYIDESIATDDYCEIGIYLPIQSLPQTDIVEPIIDRFAQ
ncbi:helix-turn-helix domain-containing protein [Paenibacillus tarimensis]